MDGGGPPAFGLCCPCCQSPDSLFSSTLETDQNQKSHTEKVMSVQRVHSQYVGVFQVHMLTVKLGLFHLKDTCMNLCFIIIVIF